MGRHHAVSGMKSGPLTSSTINGILIMMRNQVENYHELDEALPFVGNGIARNALDLASNDAPAAQTPTPETTASTGDAICGLTSSWVRTSPVAVHEPPVLKVVTIKTKPGDANGRLRAAPFSCPDCCCTIGATAHDFGLLTAGCVKGAIQARTAGRAERIECLDQHSRIWQEGRCWHRRPAFSYGR